MVSPTFRKIVNAPRRAADKRFDNVHPKVESVFSKIAGPKDDKTGNRNTIRALVYPSAGVGIAWLVGRGLSGWFDVSGADNFSNAIEHSAQYFIDHLRVTAALFVGAKMFGRVVHMRQVSTQEENEIARATVLKDRYAERAAVLADPANILMSSHTEQIAREKIIDFLAVQKRGLTDVKITDKVDTIIQGLRTRAMAIEGAAIELSISPSRLYALAVEEQFKEEFADKRKPELLTEFNSIVNALAYLRKIEKNPAKKTEFGEEREQLNNYRVYLSDGRARIEDYKPDDLFPTLDRVLPQLIDYADELRMDREFLESRLTGVDTLVKKRVQMNYEKEAQEKEASIVKLQESQKSALYSPLNEKGRGNLSQLFRVGLWAVAISEAGRILAALENFWMADGIIDKLTKLAVPPILSLGALLTFWSVPKIIMGVRKIIEEILGK